MKLIRPMIAGCLAFLLLVSTGQAIDVSAKSAVLYEVSTGRVLYQKNMEEPRAIASTTKIMTALLTIENTDLTEKVTIKPEFTGIEGTSLYLKAGEQITVETLLYGLMLQSGNDAALVLADHVAGDIPTFVSMMNARAQELGMENTHFENPNGLPAEGHVSSALDMAKLAAAAMQNPDFQKVVSSKTYAANGRAFSNHNRLLKMREDIDGVKTGFTKAAGRCLVSSSLRDNMRLVAVTLSDPDDWDDHMALYDYGFAAFGRKSFVKEGENAGEIPVAGSGLRIGVRASGNLDYVDEKTMLQDVSKEVHAPHFCYAPVHEGDIIGEIQIKKAGTVIARCDLIATESIELPKNEGFIERYFGWLWKS